MMESMMMKAVVERGAVVFKMEEWETAMMKEFIMHETHLLSIGILYFII